MIRINGEKSQKSGFKTFYKVGTSVVFFFKGKKIGLIFLI